MCKYLFLMLGNLLIVRPVILCGGVGSRLWPESRTTYPKQFINLFNGKSLLEITLERYKNKKIFSDPIIVSNSKFKFYIINILKKLDINSTLLLEPVGRGTTASIFLASRYVEKNEILFISPSDHIIDDFKNLNENIIKITKTFPNENIFTFGIKPTYSSSGFGYIKVKKNTNFKNIFEVDKFIEKPKQNIAEKYIKDSNYFWNSGIFMASSETFLRSIFIHAQEIYDLSEHAYSKASKDTFDAVTFPLKYFQKIPNLSIDYSVMEKSNKIKCCTINLSWNDLGSWDMFSKLNHNVHSENHFEIDSSNNFLKSKKKIIATIGIKDTIIIENNDAILAVKKGMTEKVKDLISIIKKKNPNVIQGNNFDLRPWGKFEVLHDTSNCKVKKLTIKPKSRLSLQYHKYRSEHWTIINGLAKVYLDENIYNLKSGDSIDIPSLSRHYVENTTNSELIIIEIQMGTYFGEDDIIRIDDPYHRDDK